MGAQDELPRTGQHDGRCRPRKTRAACRLDEVDSGNLGPLPLGKGASRESLFSMRILITGATGFVGGWLASELANAYPQALLFGTSHGPSALAPLPDEMQLLPCDLSDKAALGEVIAESAPDRVFHLAGFASGAGTDREKIFRINVDATVGLLELLRDAGRPCQVQLASSGYVYGATEPGRPALETDIPTPSGAYAESKAVMEEAVRSFASDTLSLTITRSFNHTGPRQSPEFVVPAFARQIARIEKGLEPPTVRVGNLEASRDFLSVRDVVRAYRLLLCETAPEPWRVVNVASGEGVSIRSLLDTLVAHSTETLSVETDPARMRPSDLPECIGDSTALSTLTGWKPEVSMDTTLAETLEWWRTVTAADTGKA
jgi:GDP-4-dehydro-6-deoxy-D-mannose reductase